MRAFSVSFPPLTCPATRSFQGPGACPQIAQSESRFQPTSMLRLASLSQLKNRIGAVSRGKSTHSRPLAMMESYSSPPIQRADPGKNPRLISLPPKRKRSTSRCHVCSGVWCRESNFLQAAVSMQERQRISITSAGSIGSLVLDYAGEPTFDHRRSRTIFWEYRGASQPP